MTNPTEPWRVEKGALVAEFGDLRFTLVPEPETSTVRIWGQRRIPEGLADTTLMVQRSRDGIWSAKAEHVDSPAPSMAAAKSVVQHAVNWERENRLEVSDAATD